LRVLGIIEGLGDAVPVYSEYDLRGEPSGSPLLAAPPGASLAVLMNNPGGERGNTVGH